jgi:hypothetical protein
MSGHIDARRLLALGLGEAPSSAEAEHLAGCPDCAAGPAQDAQLWWRFRQLELPAPPPRFSAGALARFRKARAVRHRPREVILGGLLVAAMVALFCLWALRLAPGVVVTLALSLPRWSNLMTEGNGWTRVLTSAVPVLVLSAALLLGGFAMMLRRLTTVAAK